MRNIKRFIPKPIRIVLRPFYRISYRYIIYPLSFRLKYGFWPPPLGTDLSGYEVILDLIRDLRLYELEGDLLEIGTFLGGGAYKLSKYLERVAPMKKLYVVDIFDPSFDWTENTEGKSMAEIYLSHLRGLSQEEIFKKIIKGCSNIVIIKSDSKQAHIPADKLCFAFIDGCHDPSYVENDFYLAWTRLISGGVVGFDDYGYDLPQVTKTIDLLISRHEKEILKIWKAGKKLIFIQRR